MGIASRWASREGKDSQTLLRLLHRWYSFATFHYDLSAVHVNIESAWPEAADTCVLMETLFQGLDLQHAIPPLELAPEEVASLVCFRCSRNRRKALFTAAVELGCNKVALGHHADDIAETTLLNLFSTAGSKPSRRGKEYSMG